MRLRDMPRANSSMLLCGAIGGLLFIVTLLIEGSTRADYDPLRHPVSSLALGPFGWMQIANFVITGLLMFLFAIGLRRSLHAAERRSIWGPLLVGIYAISLIGAGVFVTDPVSGYPVGTPAQGVHTWHGTLHDFPFSLLVFAALAAACFVFARRFMGWGEPRWAIYSAATGILVVIGYFLSGQAFSQIEGLVEIGGLIQRLTIVVGWGWLSLLAIHQRNAAERHGSREDHRVS